jgi:hypothetical protein
MPRNWVTAIMFTNSNSCNQVCYIACTVSRLFYERNLLESEPSNTRFVIFVSPSGPSSKTAQQDLPLKQLSTRKENFKKFCDITIYIYVFRGKRDSKAPTIKTWRDLRFEILAVENILIAVFCGVTPYYFVSGYQRFKRTYSLHFNSCLEDGVDTSIQNAGILLL